MCIIIAKLRGKELPKKAILQTCWNNNDDGAGFMIAHDGSVEIVKGFLKFDDFYKALKKYDKKYKLKNKNIVIHFRIGTSGGLTSSKTHPFAISKNINDLNATNIKTNVGVAHNGILSNFTYNSKLSDTQNFVKDFIYYVYKMDEDFIHNKNADELILNQLNTSNKLAILTKNDELKLYNDFIEEDGVYYSNNTYKEDRYKINNYNFNYNYNYKYLDDFDDDPIYNNILDYKKDFDLYDDALYYEYEDAIYDDFIKGNITEDEMEAKLNDWDAYVNFCDKLVKEYDGEGGEGL